MKTVTSTRHPGENHSTTHRLSVVAGACALALGASLAHAQTQTSTYTSDLTTVPAVQTLANANYMLAVTSPQFNQGITSATVQTAPTLANISLTGGGATPATVTNNSATATAASNQNTTTASLNTLTNSGGADGIGTLAAQVQQNGASNALVNTSVVSITETGMLPAAASITGNSLSASTTINRSDTTVSGAVPVGYSSTANGSIDVGYDAAAGVTSNTIGTGSATTTASVNLNTFQTSLNASANANSAAQVTDSKVQLDISGTSAASGAPVLSAPITVSNNTLSAQFDVNKSSNVFQATAGSASFTGSVGVTNVQANIESASSATSASVTGSSITSNLTRRDTNATVADRTFTALTGTLDQSGNTISASSSGNSAGDRNAAGSILAGNAILLTSGADLTGTGSTTANAQTSGATTATSNTQADLALLNLQRNDTTNLKSSVTDGVISARADNVTTGSITLNSNAVASAAQGNLAGNLIEVIATNSTATAAAANVQANSGTPIEASNSGSGVSVGVGYTGQKAADAVAGTVTLNQNSLSATASGNASATNVVMLASNLTAQASPGGAASVNVASGATTATAGLSATNLQSNISVTGTPNNITASLGTAGVSALFTETGTTGTPATDIPVALSGATVSLDQNALVASATGNSASTGVTLTGAAGATSNATVQAAVGNSQLNDGTNGLMTVSSALSDVGVRTLAGAATNSQLSVNSNTQSASATGSRVSNTLAANVSNLTVGPNALAAGPAALTTTDATSTAALGLASVQINQEATVTASNMSSTPFAGAQLSSAAGSQLAVNNNLASATSTGNSVTNTVQVIATNMASTTGAANAIAALSNLQSNDVTGMASAEVGASSLPTTPLVGVQVGGGVTAASSLTVSGNDVNATALGNTGTNQMAVTGSNLSSTAPAVATGLSSTAATGVPTGGNVSSEFALANFQNDAVSGGRTADATNVVVGINTTGALTSSNLTVVNNQVTAEARNNQISNTANLTGFATLTTSAGLLNTQNATTAVTATVTDASTGVVAGGDIVNANVTIDRNAVQGLATGSSANNSLSVSAAALAGNPKTTITQTGVATTNQMAGTAAQTADFSLANSQRQANGEIKAVVTGTQTINDSGASTVNGSQLNVSGNSVQGVAQSLSASNVLALSGTTSASASAALGNLQSSSAAVTASTTATQGVVAAAITAVGATTASNLAVSGNTAKALAVGTSASNALSATSANLSGNSQLTSNGGGASYTVASTAAVTTADFAVSNVQNQSGALTSTLDSTQMINVAAAAVNGGALTVSGNTAASVAQANSAGSSLTLTGANQSNLTGALLSVQTATAGVSASQVAKDGTNSLAVRTSSLNTTAVTVSNNNLLVSAGMNEAFNQQTVSGATLAADTSRGNETAEVTLGGVTTLTSASSGAAFSVQNVQSGATTGSVSASAQPALIGISNSGSTVADSNLTVADNAVTAKANVNYASNALNLAASNTLAGSGSVNNVQTSAVTSGVTATIGDSATPVNVGIAPPVPVSGSTLTVSGNALNAQVGGNTAVNALNATALNSIGNGSVTAPTSSATSTPSTSNTATFAVLNYQGNSSAMTATVQYASIGLGASTSLVNSSATVQYNTVLASGYGNTASNSLGMSALTGNANAASSGISNVQYNTGSVTALVSNVSNGIVGGAGVSGGQTTVSGNSIAAQAVGNSAVNRIVALR